MRPFIILLLLCSSLVAQETPRAVIKGPTQVLAGTLLFLSHEDAVGDNKVWIIPEDLKNASASCGGNIFFAIPTPGEYSFGLIVADKQARIDYAYHKVKVVSSPGNGGPAPEPDEPDIPVPVPKPTFDTVISISKAGAAKLNDPTTAQALKQSLQALVVGSAGKTLDQLITDTKRVVSVSLALRKGDSWKKDWGLEWVYPVDLEIAKLKIQNPADYVKLLEALANSL